MLAYFVDIADDVPSKILRLSNVFSGLQSTTIGTATRVRSKRGDPRNKNSTDLFHSPLSSFLQRYNDPMATARYVHWQDGELWIGYFEEFPDYLTQGESIAELEENLRDLYRDITSGEIPGIRRVAELSVG